MADPPQSPSGPHPTRTSTASSTSSISTTSSSSLTPTNSPSHRRPNRKAITLTDPFATLPEPSRDDERAANDAASDSSFTRLVASPLLFVAFLLSLLYVDRRNRSRRVAARARAPDQNSLWRRWCDFWDPEPYCEAAAEGERAGVRTSGEVKDGAAAADEEDEARVEKGSRSGKSAKWYAHTKQRHVASLEAAEAFELVDRVKAVVASVVVLGTVGVGWVALKVWEVFQ